MGSIRKSAYKTRQKCGSLGDALPRMRFGAKEIRHAAYATVVENLEKPHPQPHHGLVARESWL